MLKETKLYHINLCSHRKFSKWSQGNTCKHPHHPKVYKNKLTQISPELINNNGVVRKRNNFVL